MAFTSVRPNTTIGLNTNAGYALDVMIDGDLAQSYENFKQLQRGVGQNFKAAYSKVGDRLDAMDTAIANAGTGTGYYFAQSTVPSSPPDGCGWVNTGASPNVLKVYDVSGTTWRDQSDVNSAQTLSNKVLDTPTVADFTNATHDHSSDAQGGLVPGGSPSAIDGLGYSVKDDDEVTFETGGLKIAGDEYRLHATTDVTFSSLDASNWYYLNITKPSTSTITSSDFSASTVDPTKDSTYGYYSSAVSSIRTIGMVQTNANSSLIRCHASDGKWAFDSIVDGVFYTSSAAVTSATSIPTGVPVFFGGAYADIRAHVLPGGSRELYIAGGYEPGSLVGNQYYRLVDAGGGRSVSHRTDELGNIRFKTDGCGGTPVNVMLIAFNYPKELGG